MGLACGCVEMTDDSNGVVGDFSISKTKKENTVEGMDRYIVHTI
jgi:hypothetical protein